MSDWLHDLPLVWMVVVVFGSAYLIAAVIYAVVVVLRVGEWARSFKALSPGLLPPLGILFGLFVAFTAAQVWNDNERANTVVIREASALRSVIVLAASFPGEPESRLRAPVLNHIDEAVTREWPMMSRQAATLSLTPRFLVEAMRVTLVLTPNTTGQQIAQRELAAALETALDGRQQRIIISRSEVNLVKWACLYLQAVCALAAIAILHSDNRRAALLALAIFATGVGASVLLVLAHDRPFIGDLSVKPAALLQVMPEATR